MKVFFFSLKKNQNLKIVAGIAVIFLAALIMYRDILFINPSENLVPWGSDALSHVMKAEYLYQKAQEGVFFPEFYPGWYLGAQIFRYYPPIPYYLIAVIKWVSGLSFLGAVNWFLFICALLGSISWLSFRRWIGWLPAVAGGMIFLILPDSLRVAFSEGNYPRVLTTACIPLMFYFLLRSLEKDGARLHRLGLSVIFSFLVLSHAMMAAIYAVCCVLLVGIIFLFHITSLRRTVFTIACIALGIISASWWLLPSLSGGITEQDLSYWSHIITPWKDLLNPIMRLRNQELVYLGVSLMLLPTAALIFKRFRSGMATGLTIVGAGGILINTVGFNELFNALPLHTLLMPYRFFGIASFLLLLSLLWQSRYFLIHNKPVVFGLIVITVAIDCWGSTPVINLRPAGNSMVKISEKLASTPGWRVASLDLGSLGPGPSYFFSSLGEREQVYGWSYYAARAASNISALDENLQTGNLTYVFDRLNLYGADDIVVPTFLKYSRQITQMAMDQGFQSVMSNSQLSLMHRDGQPRAIIANWQVLGIGNGVRNLSFIFPQMISGTSNRIDDYRLDDLCSYKTVVLSGFSWADRKTAEELVEKAAAAGTNIIIDLTSVAEDPLARIPHFLDVWGEKIILPADPIKLVGEGKEIWLQPFGEDGVFWYTQTPQGLDYSTLVTDYLGETASVLGYKSFGESRVWFLGLNLPYHAYLSKDDEAKKLLSVLVGISKDNPSQYTSVPLSNYLATSNGYRFDVSVNQQSKLVFPVAFIEGMKITVDGQQELIDSIENLVVFDVPSGKHSVEIQITPTIIYSLGLACSGIGLAGILVILYREKRLWSEN